jgi:ATP-binding cassette subfamily F protein 3
MSIVRLTGIHREIGTLVILDRIDAAVAAGDRIGLVGPNGGGKTTLLRIVAGIDEPDRGEVGRKRGLAIGMLAQEAHLDATFMATPDLRTAVRSGAAEVEDLERQLAAMESAGRAGEAVYADARHRFEAADGYHLDQRVDETLSGLGFERSDWTRPPASLSGGEQTRAALARLVVADPDLLLLDEPTNHLDIGALEWLEGHLRRRTGALIVASHDRAFLDATVGRIWELRDRRLTVFRGDYSAYRRQREERDARATREADSQVVAIARERELVQTYRSHRKFAKMHEHEARLEALLAARIAAPRAARGFRLPMETLAGGAPVRSGEIVLRIEDLVIGYTSSDTRSTAVARAPSLVAARGDRVGIVGPNGAGKTTLLRTIAGSLAPLGGSLSFGHNIQLGYLAQLREAGIAGTTVLDAITEALPVTAGQARSYLARFLFLGDEVDKEVRSLSGGERSRLELALLGLRPANLLLLDEPTNHLDIAAREAIETFLQEVPATILVVSHDRRLLETLCQRLWVVGDGAIVPYGEGYLSWREAVASGWTIAQTRSGTAGNGRPGPAPQAPTARTAAVATASRGRARSSGRRAGSGGSRQRLSKDAFRRRSSEVEAELTRLGLRRNHLELSLADPAVQANYVEMRRVSAELADVDAALAAAEDAWLELQEMAP